MFLAGEHRKDGPVFGAMLCEGEASRLQQGTRQKKKAQDQAKNTRDRGGDEEEWPHLAGNWQENKISSTLTKTSQKKEEHCPA